MSILRLAVVAALISTPAHAIAPARVASLNLCTDELALLLAAPRQLVSVSRLAADRHETRLAPRAARLHRNRGTIESVAALRPDLVLTGGARTRHAAELARAIGARVLDIPPATNIAEVRANIRGVAAALGRARAGEALVASMDAALGPLPARQTRALLLQGGGYTPPADGLAAAYLAHAGLAQARHPGGRVTLEALIARPPAVLVTSAYRAGQPSLHQAWLAHPALARLPARRVTLDGRGWTCLGALAALDLPALRRSLAR